MTYSFFSLEPVFCSMSSSKCCFLTCSQVSQEAGRVVWCSHLLQNFPQFIVIYSQSFGIVNKAEIDVFLELSCFFNDSTNVCNLISGSSAFSKTFLKCLMVEGTYLSDIFYVPLWHFPCKYSAAISFLKKNSQMCLKPFWGHELLTFYFCFLSKHKIS